MSAPSAGSAAPLPRSADGGAGTGDLLADGVMSALAAIFGTLPNTSYSQNVGLINFTGVASRHVTAVGGMLLVALGTVPKVGALFATVPPAVIGGGGLIMFAMIFASGAAIVQHGVTLRRREMIILAVAIGLGLAVEWRPQALAQLPERLQLFLGSGLVTGGLGAVALNLLFPPRRPATAGR